MSLCFTNERLRPTCFEAILVASLDSTSSARAAAAYRSWPKSCIHDISGLALSAKNLSIYPVWDSSREKSTRNSPYITSSALGCLGKDVLTMLDIPPIKLGRKLVFVQLDIILNPGGIRILLGRINSLPMA